MFTINDEIWAMGRPGNKAVKEVVCTGYNTASCNHSYRWASLIGEQNYKCP